MLVEVLHREASIEVWMSPSIRSISLTGARRGDGPGEGPATRPRPLLPMPMTPSAKCPFTDTQQLRRLHLASVLTVPYDQAHPKPHPAYPLVNTCPVHPNPLDPGDPDEPDTSRATNSGQIHELATIAPPALDRADRLPEDIPRATEGEPTANRHGEMVQRSETVLASSIGATDECTTLSGRLRATSSL